MVVLATSNICAQNSNSLLLYTPFTKVSVAPGKSVEYSIDLINKGSAVRNEDITVTNIPKSWSSSLTAGGYTIHKLAVLPDEKKTVKFKIEVPFQVKKGNYTLYAKAGAHVSLPLVINVSSAGSGDSELTCDQKNMEGNAKSSFSFKAVLKNRTAAKQQYALMANAPRGWTVAIKPNFKQATSTEVDANSTKDITFDVKAPSAVKAGTYKIPVKAVAGSTSANLEFEVVITGTYEMTLGTPSGLASTHVTAGNTKKVELLVRNGGSADLNNVELKASKPKNWQVSFEPKKIEKLMPGKTETVFATITADSKAIPGDYVSKFEAKTPEVTSAVSFRVSVKTPLLMGWLGILVIALALAAVFYLFKKYGRR